jgi:putative ABC transport system permease protein
MKGLLFDELLWDARAAVRNMAKTPVACAVAVISIAAGIGATTATLTIRDAVFFNPPPLYRNPEELTIAGISMPDRPRRQPVPAELYASWVQAGQSYSAIAAAGSARSADVRTRDLNTSAAVRPVTPGLFPLLGVAPLLGRTFSLGGAKGQESPDVILSYQSWQGLFGGDPRVIGTLLWVDDHPYTVIGVMPKRFWFSDMETTLWTYLDPPAGGSQERFEVVIRRKPGIKMEALAEALRGPVDRYAASLHADERRLRLQVAEITGTPIAREIGPIVVWLFEASVFLILLISCTNVAVLLIALWSKRRQEIAVHAALGAGRGRILKSLLTESVLLAVFGGGVGLWIVFALVRHLVLSGAPNIDLFNIAVGARILIQSASITFLAGIFAGVGPALLETRDLEANPLRHMRSDHAGQRWRHALVVLEISVTMALLILASIMLDGYRRALSTDQGFDRSRLVAARVDAADGIKTLEICRNLSDMPGVAGAAAATAVPLAGRGARQRCAADAAGSVGVDAENFSVSSGFFAALGVPIRSGRGFAPQDDSPGGAPVAVINETLARSLFAGRNPVGTRIWNSGNAYEVVGVVADYLWIPLARPAAGFYLPLSQQSGPRRHMQFVVKAKGDPAGLVRAARAEIRRIHPAALLSVFTMQSTVEAIGREIATVIYPMTSLIAIGIFLTAAGIYAVMAFTVSRRSKEIALRMALGAAPEQVLGLVASLSLRMILTGIVLGTVVMFGLSRVAQGSGGVFDARSPTVFVVPILVLLAVGAFATWMPSRRAITIDPAMLLRDQ